MLRFTHPVRLGAACLIVMASWAAAEAARPSETLLPSTTKGFLSIGDFGVLRDSWNKTQLGQLMQDPVMKPFTDDLKRQIQSRWSKSHQKLGLEWDDLEGIPSGEIAVAMVLPAKDEAAIVILVDIKGHEKETAALIAKISKKLTAAGAKQSKRQSHGVTITQFDTVKTEEAPAAHAAYFVKDGLLGVSDHAQVLDGVLVRMGTEATDSLATTAAYGAVMKRCQTAAGDAAPHIRWFLEPFGYVDAMRAATPAKERRKGLDLAKILRNQGFTAIQGLGGYLNFATDRYEMLHRTAIYAPPVKAAGDERYELAARMLDFPKGGNLEPPAWTPREVATYASFNWNISKAFEASSTLVNEVVGENVFEDIITSMLEDPNGPQIDVRKDLIGRLGTRGIVISDYKLPITPKSERLLFAIATNDEAVLAQTIEKAMKSDENARRREYNGHVIWEVVTAEEELAPAVADDGSGTQAPAEEESEGEVKLPNSAVTVAFGHLLVSTHIDFLEKVLSENESLASSTDYQIIRAELEKLTGSEASVQAFSRTDEEYRALYELIRTDKMPEAETMLARLLNAVLGEGNKKKGILRHQKIDGHNLPEYEAVRRYFGPAGLSVLSEDNGWFVTGFTINKNVGQPSDPSLTDTTQPDGVAPAPAEVAPITEAAAPSASPTETR